MKRFILLYALFIFILTGSGAWAECELKAWDGDAGRGVGVWTGPCSDGKAYGKGRAVGENWTYEGGAQEGSASGQGTWRLDDGGSYSGAWREGIPHGTGIMVDSEGDRRTGEFRYGKLHGRGSGSSPRDGHFTGEWRDGRPVHKEDPRDAGARKGEYDSREAGGRARAVPVASKCRLDTGGESLEWRGPCSDGKAYGNGGATASDGTKYTGSARNGEPHGYGTLTSAGGRLIYQGDYRNGTPHGRGTFRGQDGLYYITRFDNGKEVGERTPVQGTGPKGFSPKKAGGTDPWGDKAVDEGDPWDEGVREREHDSREAGAGPADDYDNEAAIEALDGVVRVAIPNNDGYAERLTELERKEAEAHLTAIARESERFAKEVEKKVKEELAAERHANFKAEQKRRREALDAAARRGAESLNKFLESAPRQGGAEKPLWSRRLKRNMDRLNKRARQWLKDRREQQRREARERERRQALERKRIQERERQRVLEIQRRQARQRQQAIAPPPAAPSVYIPPSVSQGYTDTPIPTIIPGSKGRRSSCRGRSCGSGKVQ